MVWVVWSTFFDFFFEILAGLGGGFLLGFGAFYN